MISLVYKYGISFFILDFLLLKNNMARQLDILATGGNWFTIPDYVPGRLNAKDFINFHWHPTINPSDYTVVVETLDMSDNNPLKGISKLAKNVRLPHVQFGWNPILLLVPNSSSKPMFRGILNRASTYIVPDVRGNGIFPLEEHGMKISPGL